jgi:hypothetical protein
MVQKALPEMSLDSLDQKKTLKLKEEVFSLTCMVATSATARLYIVEFISLIKDTYHPYHHIQPLLGLRHVCFVEIFWGNL